MSDSALADDHFAGEHTLGAHPNAGPAVVGCPVCDRDAEIIRWQRRAHDAEAAMVQMDAKLEKKPGESFLRDAIDACMRNLMPVRLHTAAGAVRFMACDLFSNPGTYKVVNHHGNESIAYEEWTDTLDRPIAVTRTRVAHNTAELMNGLNGYIGATTGGLVCLLHPSLLEQVIRDFAQMRLYDTTVEPTQEQPEGES